MSTPAHRQKLPPRVLPWLYFGSGYVSLALAFAAIAWDPRGTAGFFYHARIVGIVHLVTLGWITVSILGALYVVAPAALRTPMRGTWRDATAFAFVIIGIIGMVAHFWIERFSGMAWSGAMVALGILYVGWRVIRGMWRAPIPPAVKWHVGLAFANIAAAATMGVLLGFDKVFHFLPGFVLSNVIAHAHFAAIGWAGMMVVGVGYRLLPMVLPAAPPTGRTLFASAALLETGAVGLFVTLLLRSRWSGAFAIVTVAGFVAFGAHLAGMLRRRKPPAAGLPRPDYAVRHAALAMTCLVTTVAIGLWLAFADPSELTMRAALAYGVLGLVGFLAQMVVGMQVRLLPMLAWYSAAHRAEDLNQITPPARLIAPRLSAVVWTLWLWGVPALAVGFFVNGVPLLVAGALALEAAVLLGGVHAARIAAHVLKSTGDEAPNWRVLKVGMRNREEP